MKNPFTTTGKVMSDLWRSAEGSDCAPGPAKVGVVILAPIVAPVTFVAALFQKKEGSK